MTDVTQNLWANNEASWYSADICTEILMCELFRFAGAKNELLGAPEFGQFTH